MSIACKVYSDSAGSNYDYEITFIDETYRVWLSYGPMTGRFIGERFESFDEALAYLAKFIKDSEFIYQDA